jgi:hypothetical protein
MISVAALLMLAAACGQSGGAKADLIKSCVDSGEDETLCTCLADGLEEQLDAKLFRKIAAEAARTGEPDDAFLESLPADEQGAVLGAMMSTGMTCAFGG